MNIIPLTQRSDQEVEGLLMLWEASVRATHHFLEEHDIDCLRPQVRHALRDVDGLFSATDSNGKICGFMGISGDKIEMLFVHPDKRGLGIGCHLVNFAVATLEVSFVDVNEQNGQGVGFYQHLGFVSVGRSTLDEQGRPFPILHMKRSEQL